MGENVKRWVIILSLLLIMVAVPAVAKNGVNVEVDPADQKLDFNGYVGEEEVFIDYLQLTARGGGVDHFRFSAHDLKRDGGGGEIPRNRVKFAGDKTLREDLPKVFPVIIRGVVEEPGTYTGKAEIVPIGQPQFDPPKPIDLSLEANVSSSESQARTWYIRSVLIACLLFGILVILAGFLRGSIPEGQRSWLDYGNFYIVTWGIVAVIIGFLGILLFVDRFGDIAQALGFMTAFFGAVVALVGTFFGIKTSSDATAEAHRTQREAAANGADKIPPKVLSTIPPDKADNVPSDIHLTATFSKGMDPITINSTTFKLLDQVTGEPVPPSPLNGVDYDEDSRMATFKPNAILQNGRRYGATITARVADEAGNALAEDHTWHFRVNTP